MLFFFRVVPLFSFLVAYIATMLSRWCFITLSAIGLSAALEKNDLQSLDSGYDYIIVRGGVSGLVVANRLSEDPQSTQIQYRMSNSAANKS